MMEKALAKNSKTKAKPRGKPFVKGVAPNPGGRPKRTPEEFELIAACKAKVPSALDTLVRIMERGENERNQLAAAQAIIERAYGKPMQPTELSGAVGLVVEIVRFSENAQ